MDDFEEDEPFDDEHYASEGSENDTFRNVIRPSSEIESSADSAEGIDPYDEAVIEKNIASDDEKKPIKSSSESLSLNNSIRKSPGAEKDFHERFDYERSFSTNDEKSEALVILKEIRMRELPFPLVRYSSTKQYVLDAFQKLKAYKPNWVERTHHELKGHTGEWWLPTVFRGKPLQFVTKKNDWWKLDMAVDFFTEYERIRARKEYDRSVEDDWYDDNQLERAIIACASKGIVNGKNLREAMFHIGARELTLFRVTKTKAFLDAIFNGDYKGKRWLDMSAGWGDRVYTACAFEMNYLGFDPNTFLQHGHEELVNLLGTTVNKIETEGEKDKYSGKRNYCFCGKKWNKMCKTCPAIFCDLHQDEYLLGDRLTAQCLKCKGISKQEDSTERKQRIIYQPFERSEKLVEDDVEKYGLFDLALTSPPFYIIERYNGENQSVDSYPEFDQWMVRFLFKSLTIIWKNLKNGGYLAINIANIRDRDMVGPMQLFIEDFLEGSQWEGIITFSGAGTQAFPGALYVWKKDIKRISTTPRGGPIRWSPHIKRSLRELFPKLYWLWVNSNKEEPGK